MHLRVGMCLAESRHGFIVMLCGGCSIFLLLGDRVIIWCRHNQNLVDMSFKQGTFVNCNNRTARPSLDTCHICTTCSIPVFNDSELDTALR